MLLNRKILVSIFLEVGGVLIVLYGYVIGGGEVLWVLLGCLIVVIWWFFGFIVIVIYIVNLVVFLIVFCLDELIKLLDDLFS